MLRHRTIAAAPARDATETWRRIADLVRETLGGSSQLDAGLITAALNVAAPAGRLLVAGGYLDRYPIVLIAPPVHLSIWTITGTAALTQSEPALVPGGATATTWRLYLPAPDPLTKTIENIVDADEHLTTEPAPEEEQAASSAPELDKRAIAERLGRAKDG